MKQKKIAIVFVLTLVFVISVSAAGISINENFDTISDGKVPVDWKVLGDAKTPATVVDKPTAHSALNCLKLVDDSPATAGGINRNIGDQAKGVLRYAVYMPENGGADFYSTLNKGEKSDGRVVDIALLASGNFKYRDQGGQTQTLLKINKNVWHFVEVKWDVTAVSFSLTLDGKKLGDFPLIKSMVPDTIIFKAGNNDMTGATVYLDSIELKTE